MNKERMEEKCSQPSVQRTITLSFVSAISVVSVVERSPFCSGVISVSRDEGHPLPVLIGTQ